MMESTAVDEKKWCDYKTMDQIYNECLEYLRKFAKQETFSTKNGNRNSDSVIDAKHSRVDSNENDVEQGELLDTIMRRNLNDMPIVYDNPRTKLIKGAISKSSGNRRIRPRRVVTKTGLRNIARIMNIPQHSKRFFTDIFTTLIESRWRWIMFWTVAGHFICWLFFAVLWYLTGLAHYDFEENPPEKLCVTGGHSFLSIFLASIEAQTTVAYGDRSIDETCPETIFIYMMNLIIGTGLSGALTSVLFSKLTRPDKMAREGVGFSKNAVICLRDGQLCMMFRIWDLNQIHIVGTDVSAHVITAKRTLEGELLKHHPQELKLKDRNIFMMWPSIIIHVVDENSPFYDMSAKDFLDSTFEIVVSLKGASFSTGIFSQSLASYLPREVVWGYRFRNVLRYSENNNKYVIDHSHLNSLDQIDTPLCSAKKLHQVCEELGIKSSE